MNCWILQCNINHYRWLDQMKEHKNDYDKWGINQYISEIEPCDIAFIWLTKCKRKETRGIYAMAKITGLPGENADEIRMKYTWEDKYWTNIEEKERRKSLINLELRYTELIIDKYISKDELEAAGLENLLILKMH